MRGYGWTATMLALTLFACGGGGDDGQVSEVVWHHPATGGVSGGETQSWTAGTSSTGGDGGGGGVGARESVGGGRGEHPGDSCVYVDTSPIAARQLYGLEINGSGFDAYEGQLARMTIWTNPDWIAVAQERVMGGAFKFELPLALTDYSSVSLYIDEDGNDACSDGEPTWSYTSGAGACTSQPCPPPGGTHVENLRLPLDECSDCGPWRAQPLAELGIEDHCVTGTGNDLAEALPCPP